MADQINIQVKFTKTDANGNPYNDALLYPLVEYNKLTTEKLEQDKQDRVDAHNQRMVEAINAPAEVPPLEDQVLAIDQQIESLQSQKESLIGDLSNESADK